MIVAGIDEAGYGPVLGPLVVGASAFRVAGEASTSGDVPDLWKLMSAAVSRTRDRSGRKLHVGDSKQVYSPSVGLSGLERGVLAFCGAAGMPVGSLDELVLGVDPAAPPLLGAHPWYESVEGETWPVVVSAAGLGPTVNGLKSAATAGGVGVVRLAARVVPEGRYNQLVAGTRNKASALFSQLAVLLDGLLELCALEPGGGVIVCDRQGGREHYVEPLRTMFPEWRLTVEAEADGVARYSLRRGGAVAVVSFQEKGEQVCLATGLASMTAKYLREALMGRFNRWWALQQPGLAPTAGYYTDGMRWLEDTRDLRVRLGVPDAGLVRER